MIDTLIFDFGDIFIDLRHDEVKGRFAALGVAGWNEAMQEANRQFEIGRSSETEFLSALLRSARPGTTITEMRAAWNAMLGDFPLERLEFLQLLSERYRIFLLSNTDAIHIAHFEEMVGDTFSAAFYRCFEKTYFSFEIGMRKPDPSLFEYVLDRHGLSPKRTLFVDDKKENTDAAAALGIRTWNLQVGHEDVTDLFDKKLLD